MIVSPLWGKHKLSQKFGANPKVYLPRHNGHAGCDWVVPKGTLLHAAMSGWCLVRDTGKQGYGLHILQHSPERGLRLLYAHLSNSLFPEGTVVFVNEGDLIGSTGDSGFGWKIVNGKVVAGVPIPHFHLGMQRTQKFTDASFKDDILLDRDNGMGGFIDPLPFILATSGRLVDQ